MGGECSLGNLKLNSWKRAPAEGQPKMKVYISEMTLKSFIFEDFPGAPVVKNPPSNAGDGGSVPVGELRSHIPRDN